MSKKEIPIPQRDDEFTDLDDELGRAMKAVEQHNRITETALREFMEAEGPVGEDEGADATTETSEAAAAAEPAEAPQQTEAETSEKSEQPEQEDPSDPSAEEESTEPAPPPTDG